MKKIFLTGLLVLSCVLAFASGQQGASGTGGTDRAAALAEIGFNATGYPIVTKPYSFTATVSKGPMHATFSTMPAVINMEKKTGITVEWIEIPTRSYTEQKNLILASNDLPDVFMDGLTDADILQYSQLGVFVPIDPYIDQYAPNMKIIFDQMPGSREFMTTPSGHIYTFIKSNGIPHRINPDNWFINKQWLDKLGLAIPKTMDEFHAVLKAFKEKDPNGNGKADEIPFSFKTPVDGVGGNRDITSLFAMFGMFDNANHLMVKDQKVYFTAASDSFKNACTWFNQLYSEGLIDREAFSHTDGQYVAKGNNPEVIFGSYLDWFDENTVGPARAREVYTTQPPLVGVDGKQRWGRITDANAFLNRGFLGITNRMKHPEVAVRWGDLCLDWATSLEMAYGPWDICIKRDGDRVIMLPSPPGIGQDEYRYTQCPVTAVPWVVSQETFRNMDLTENHIRKFERLDLYSQYFPPQEEFFPQVFFLEEEVAELSILRTDITNYVAQMRARFIIGTESIANNWNTYVTTLNQMGLARYLELNQQALDRYYGN